MEFTPQEMQKILRDKENLALWRQVKSGELKVGRLVYDKFSRKLQWIPVPIRKHGVMTTVHTGGRVTQLYLCNCRKEGVKCPEQ